MTAWMCRRILTRGRAHNRARATICRAVCSHAYGDGRRWGGDTRARGAQENESTILANLARRGADWVCNSVNSSSVDSDGLPDYISAGTGFSVNISGGTTPIKMDIAGYYQHITTNTSILSLTASSSSGANCHRVVYYDNGTDTYGGMVWNIDEICLSVNDDTSGFDYSIRYGASTSATSGYYRLFVKRGW